MPIKQYVNMPQSDNSNDRQGRWFGLNIAVSEEASGASQGGLIYLFLVPDPNNVPKIMVSAANRATGFQFVPNSRKLVVVDEGRAAAWCRLSINGGDKYKFKAGRRFDMSGAVESGVEVETWRKIFVRYGFMMSTDAAYTDAPTANWGTVRSEMEAVFIECETDGPIGLMMSPWSRDSAAITEMDRGRAAMPFPDQSTKMAFVNRIGRKGTMSPRYIDFTPAMLQGNKIWYWTLPDNEYTWPEETDWVSGRIECLDASNNVIQNYPTISHTVFKSTTGGFRHPDGLAAHRIKFDFRRWGLTNWIRAGQGKLRVHFSIRNIDDTAMGLAWPTPPRILIATRHPKSYGTNTTLDNTVVHEIGHNLGLNVRLLPEYNETSGAREDEVVNATWYDNTNGGVGTHCSTGASLNSRNHYINGTCTMLHYVNGVTAYCGQCTPVLKRSNLSKLGKANVWPRG